MLTNNEYCYIEKSNYFAIIIGCNNKMQGSFK